MAILSPLLGFLSRLRRTLKAVRHCWRAGGYTVVQVARIEHGGVLRDKRVLITGGNAGIGLAIAKKCLEEGATVVITGRSEPKLRAAAEALNNPRLKPLVWDVADVPRRGAKLAEAMHLAGGSLDVLVNNAGLLGGHRALADLTEERWDEIMSVNAKGLVFLTQQVVTEWLARGQRGKIINLSSMRGSLGVQDGPYGMSKWAVNGFTQGLGLKLAPHGILVNGIAPGIIDTDSIAIEGMDARENAHLAGVPAGRIGLPEEVAELAVFLISDAANYIVGQTIVCDGGYTLKV